MNDDKPKGSSHDTSQETTDFASRAFASHLDIQDYSHQDYQPPTLTTDYLARPTKWEPISHSVTSNRSFASTTFMYTPVPSVVPISMRSSLATIDDASIMEVSLLYFSHSVCVFIVFCNIPQTTEYLLLYSCCLYSTGIHPPTP